MLFYICKRLLLIIPTLFGIIAINFFIIQLAPGGPIEQISAKFSNTTGNESNIGSVHLASYQGSRGLDSELIEQLRKEYGFDKPLMQRFWLVVENFVKLDFGTSFYREAKVIDIIKEKMPTSISLGVFSTIIIYLISIPLGIAKACKDGTSFDTFTSSLLAIGYAIPSFLFAILLIMLFCGGSFWDILPMKGLVSENFEELSFADKILDYLQHLILPLVCICIGGFASLTLLVKNSFLDEISKTYVVLAMAKGASNASILYGHVFRNACLLLVSLFPATFIGMFFSSNLLIEIVFSLDGLGLLGYDSIISRDYPVIFGTLFIFTLIGLIVNIISDILYMIIDPRITFDKAY
ncbi:microcin C ABC transporter permease YejB [Helicobacter aurati]|uniref:Microcin C ABC transporter permease YejB n=1 Tax=Helicobacter aurati TaxID=137778 RepID=A0A3D8J7F0_9HELI|nr:microcin C ABC transporter permease YejB [Helicobacter aurati]RDU73433.1 microcin C ABC transporter permease YejB [Helicobacter aurati]